MGNKPVARSVWEFADEHLTDSNRTDRSRLTERTPSRTCARRASSALAGLAATIPLHHQQSPISISSIVGVVFYRGMTMQCARPVKRDAQSRLNRAASRRRSMMLSS